MKRLLIAVVAMAFAMLSSGSIEPVEAKFTQPYNHPDLDWYTIETEHFFVHYPVSKVTREEGNDHYINAEYSARRSAKVAEEMWAPMCAEFNYFLKEKVHIVILDQPDHLEGFTIPAWDWIEISANPGGYFYRMRGRMEWFSDVIVHEFAHVVSLKTNESLSEGMQGVSIGGLYSDGINNSDTGVSMFVMGSEPFWWTEGGAEYWSDNTGYNWWSSSRDMNIRMTVLEDRLLTFDEWVSRVDKREWGDGERGYQQGYSMALYLRERFGDETYARFAIEYGKGWRPNWETVIEDVLGIDAETLYYDWVDYITAKYEGVWEQVKAEGEVAGHELAMAPNDWEFTNPDARDAWEKKDKRDQEDHREATGMWRLEPRWSDDGKYIGWTEYSSVTVMPLPEDSLLPYGGTYPDAETASRAFEAMGTFPGEFAHAWDFVPGQEAIVTTVAEDRIKPHGLANTVGLYLEDDGYNWKELWYIELVEHEREVKGKEFTSLRGDTFLNRPTEGVSGYPIPNTKRGTDPAVSPDGTRVAYLEYEDGTINIVVINLDGTNKTYITDYDDGTWMQRVDWSPDGTQLVFGVFRNYQNDLFIANADGTGELKAITWDHLESFDAHWGWDGKIYFSSDPGGIFNLFSYDPETGEVLQLTNVIGGAQSPYLTPEGNLTFVMYTAHGFKIWGVGKDEFFNKPANHLFNMDVDEELVSQALAYSEDLSVYADVTTPYRWTRAFMSPSGVPVIRYAGQNRGDWGLQAGGQVFLQDFVEKHGVWGLVFLGEDNLMFAGYTNQVWYPSFNVAFVRSSGKNGFVREIDADENADTTYDRTTLEAKQSQVFNRVQADMTYAFNSNIDLMLYAQALNFGFKTTADTSNQMFMVNGMTGLMASYANRAGPHRNYLDLSVSRGYTDIVYADYFGRDTDDGELLDKYSFMQYEGRLTHHWNVTPVAGIDPFGLVGLASGAGHRFIFDFQAGYIDRNVQSNDEFRGGGRHPFRWGRTTVQPNTMFAGYPDWSLSGETMMVGHVAYGFPIKTQIRKKIGPVFVYRIDGQIMGTAGNFWSYRPPDDPSKYYTDRFDSRVAYNPADIQREVPFKDYSYKNSPIGQENYLLYDAGAEVRVSSTLFNRIPWNSFVRVAYGFNEIRGFGDVNGDNVLSTADNGQGDALSNETELPGPRVYVGVGTGW